MQYPVKHPDEKEYTPINFPPPDSSPDCIFVLRTSPRNESRFKVVEGKKKKETSVKNYPTKFINPRVCNSIRYNPMMNALSSKEDIDLRNCVRKSSGASTFFYFVEAGG